MSNNLCVATYVFGDKYQYFIPHYIFSVLKVYPDYNIKIFIDRPLKSEVAEDMKLLQGFGDFEIKEIRGEEIGLSRNSLRFDQISKAVRWLYIDRSFYNYKAVYIGDIDIFFCTEKENLYNQHIKHCDTLKLPYSNYVRGKSESNVSPQKIIKNSIKFGIKNAIKSISFEEKKQLKLSGLHFVKTKEYFNKIERVNKKFVDELNLMADGKSEKWNLCTFNNEAMLYELVQDAGIVVPKMVVMNPKQILEQTYNDINFRPHHGLHLGLWRRDRKGNINPDEEIVKSETYKEYYQYFQSILEKDSVMKKLLSNDNSYANQVINDMINYYNHPS